MTRRARERRIGARFTDPTDGLAAIIGAIPTLYWRAQDQAAGIGPVRVGDAVAAVATPTYSATGWGGVSPSVEFDNVFPAESDAISAVQLVAAQAADVRTPFAGAATVEIDSTNVHLLGWGKHDAVPNNRFAFQVDSAGRCKLVSINDAGTVQINLTSTEVLVPATRYALSWRFNGSTWRVVAKDAASERVIFNNVAAAATSGTYSFNAFWFGSAAHPSDGLPFDGRIAEFTMLQGDAAANVTDAQVLELARLAASHNPLG